MNVDTEKRKAPVAGVTGIIGSGKSAVTDRLAELGAAVIDADLLAREVVMPGTEGLRQVVALFGAEMLDEKGELRRRELGKLIFNDPDKKALLESVLHPLIRDLFTQRLLEAREKDPPLIVYAVPLLFETGYEYRELDYIVVVYAPKETCVERIMARDNCTREFAERKYDSQIPIEAKVARADYVIRNTGTVEELRKSVDELFDVITKAGGAALPEIREVDIEEGP